MNIMERLELELTCFETVVLHFNHYITVTPSLGYNLSVIVVKNRFSDQSSSPGRGRFRFISR